MNILNDYPQCFLTPRSGSLIASAERCFSPVQVKRRIGIIVAILSCALKGQVKMPFQGVIWAYLPIIQGVAIGLK